MAEEDALLREVDEELRRERLEKLWKRYGNLFLALSFGVVAAVGAYKGWQYYQQKQAQAAGEAYISALDLVNAGNDEAAIAALEKLGSGSHAGGAAMARLRLAALLGKKGETEKAVALYRQVAGDAAIEMPLRNAARVRHAWLMVDTLPRAELAKILGGLDVAGNPWRVAAWEILALASLREGDTQAALSYLKQLLNDPEVPMEARTRASTLYHLLGGDAAALAAGGNTGNGANIGSETTNGAKK